MKSGHEERMADGAQRKPVRRVVQARGRERMQSGTREGSTGRVLRVRPCSLERVWAVGEALAREPVAEGPAARAEGPRAVRDRCRGGFGRTPETREPLASERRARADAPDSRPAVELAFYRKYTEAMLRRYLRLSMETGRVPSLLGREMFRGNVTSYRVNSFEDVVLFCIDVERCLAKLDEGEKELIRRVALQQYSQGEAASLLGMSLRSVVTRYAAALDRLTGLLVRRRMLEPLKSCQ